MTEEEHKFGTTPVFFTAISTILGAILFLRFGYAVGTVGLGGTLLIIVIGHAVTIPTAMALSEIATNFKVEGGGAYYIVSRSFGLVIGATIGITLFISQAISVAFYIIAFTEAFTPAWNWLFDHYTFVPWADWLLHKSQTVAIPALFILTAIVLTKGAKLGLQTLYWVVAILTISLIAFFVGNPVEVAPGAMLPKIPEVSIFTVFAIIFPAFTGIIAGLGLSGDLKDPGRSIPLGTLTATIFGMLVYVFIAFKLDRSAPPELLANTQDLVMGKIAVQGYWLIPLGLAAATISSAIGSILVAPRTLQAIAKDKVFPSRRMNELLAQGRGKGDEPYNAYVVTVIIALAFILMGKLDAVAEIISMFFMVTYGSLCLISFMQHFAADPSYRPRFKSKWYISLFGAVACFGLMFFMNSGYAFASIFLIIALYFSLNFFNADKKNIAVIFQGVMYQISRKIHVFLQKSEKEEHKSWRPSAVFLSSNTFHRLDAFNLNRWIAYKYGFGTYIHHIDGYLSKQSNRDAREVKDRIIRMARATKSEVYTDTLINPTLAGSISQVVQLPSISGTENNLMIFDHARNKPEEILSIVENFKLIQAADFDIGILSTSERQYGLMREIHVWITPQDYENANLMILLAYVISAHPDWKNGVIKVLTVFPFENLDQEKQKMMHLISAGQLPISRNNVEFIEHPEDVELKAIIQANSADADLIVLGFLSDALKRFGAEVFTGYDDLCNILFVNTEEGKQIK
ncbi:amino acid permease [Marinilongibacter aquaticus]|uniref:amino acid permease n=1 Tax=Marinilongibacter aquaticus TaxID=2975157 RepID=UPI0021BD3F93|nr:amino acid permease [Marinilongibacter aquaticus]UBM57946.1 amino acid permease [Marinilongibacter aquaticus]